MNVKSVFEICFLEDEFLADAYNEYLTIVQDSGKKDAVIVPPYIHEFFNVKVLYNVKSSMKPIVARIINSLLEEINKKDTTLPKYLVVMVDKDLLQDINLSWEDIAKSILRITAWFVRQVNTIVRRKCVDLFDIKPGALSAFTTKIVFVRMIRRIGKFHELSKYVQIAHLRPKLNDALNDATAKIDHYIVTINSCNAYEDFNREEESVDGN